MKPDRPTAVFLGLVAFSLLGMLLTRLSKLDPGPIAPITSLLTLGAGLYAVFRPYREVAPHPLRRAGIALAIGASAELIGLATGFPFGKYAYTTVWWPTLPIPNLGPFPLALPFAWLLMASSATLAAPRGLTPQTGWRPALLGGLLAATIDLGMEPVMAGRLHYWRWLEPGPLPGGAPVANFLGWWAVGTMAGAVLISSIPPVRSTAPRWVLGGFAVLVAGLGFLA